MGKHTGSTSLVDGPVFPVLVGPNKHRRAILLKRGYPIPQPARVLAMIDTGAEGSVIDSGIIRPMNIPPTNVIQIGSTTTGNSVISAYEFDIDVAIGGGIDLRAFPLAVIEQSIIAHGIGLLLGRDLLEGCRLFYDGPAGSFILDH